MARREKGSQRPDPFEARRPGGLPHPWDPYERVGIHLFGLAMSQTFADVLLWERILNAYACVAVVELGTGEGGFSRYLATQCSYRGIRFATFDHAIPEALIPGYLQADVLSDEGQAAVVAAFADPMILFCDDGDKAAELARYAPLVPEGSLVAVHDWGTEVFREDVPVCLHPAYEEWTWELRSMTRVFTRLPDPAPEPEPDPVPEPDVA